MKKFIKLNPFTISAITVVVGIFIYAYGIPFLDLMELKTIDLRFQARGTRTPNPEILLAVIDEKSLEEQGKWVWPRSKIAALVTKLSHAGARLWGSMSAFWNRMMPGWFIRLEPSSRKPKNSVPTTKPSIIFWRT